MGNSCSHCFPSPSNRRRRHVISAVSSEPLDDGLGHSFCYVSNPISISGASVSANPSTALSTSLSSSTSPPHLPVPAAFESSDRFSSVPLHPTPRFLSGPIPDRGFLSGPIERAFLSGPLDPLPERPISSNRRRRRLLRGLSKAISRTVGAHGHGPKFKPKQPVATTATNSVENNSGFISVDDEIIHCSSRLQWAQGKAGEDRVHVVVSEEHNWVFVGIYDGFNGPDATDYLLSNLYSAVEKEIGRLEEENGDDYNRNNVLKALAEALMRTEEMFLDCADMMADENPELALMGSCVLVMLMKGEDVFLMNVGDSRAVLGTKKDLIKKMINEEEDDGLLDLDAVQLTLDHSTNIEEEVVRIRKEHPDDSMAIANDRVKGSLKVTRAFGAGFLKQPKWNNALLEMFRIDYIGTSPYITCSPSLYHHRFGAGDRFLILSSDGLYQYFTNEEAVAEVELFISTTPEGDPAQHLLEELLFRAAKKAGMDFHDLLEIPQGDRRRYHDDVSVIVISLEGRIWRSCV